MSNEKKDGGMGFQPVNKESGTGFQPVKEHGQDARATSAMPCGFNLDALGAPEAKARGVLLVEGPLDAIADCELGHPAMGLLRAGPDLRLIVLLRNFKGTKYLCLDGTPDVTMEKRCTESGKIDRLCRVCILPPGKDPDELTAAELQQAKDDARTSLAEWGDWYTHLDPKNPEEIKRVRDLFAAQVRAWLMVEPAAAGELRVEICARFGWSPAEYEAWLNIKHVAQAPSPVNTDKSVCATKEEMGRPRTPGPEPVGPEAKRPILTNVCWSEGENGKSKKTARPIDQVREDLLKILNGCLYRLRSPGSREPFLFLPRAGADYRFVMTSGQLKALAHEFADVRFAERADSQGRNFVSFQDLFQSLGGTSFLREYESIESFPHEPPDENLFYNWEWPKNYSGDGTTLAAAVGLFDNIATPEHRALFAAALITPFWGGRAGERPVFVFTAKKSGSGKTRAAQMVGWGCGGRPFEVEMSRSGDDRLKTRLLSPEGLPARVLLLDNVKKSIESQLLESLITQNTISGHRLNVGEATRPNKLLMLITANSAGVMSDMARRCFFINMEQPKSFSRTWESVYTEIAEKNPGKIAADALTILRSPRPTLGGQSEITFHEWIEEVLMRVVSFPLLRDVIGDTSIDKIIAAVLRERKEKNKDQDDADLMMSILIKYLIEKEHLTIEQKDFTCVVQRPKKEIEFYSGDVTEVVRKAREDKTKSLPGCCAIFERYIDSGLLPGLQTGRRGVGGRWFRAKKEIFDPMLDEIEKGNTRLSSDDLTKPWPSLVDGGQ